MGGLPIQEIANYTLAVLISIIVFFVVRWMNRVDDGIKDNKKENERTKDAVVEYTDSVVKVALEKFTETADTLDTTIRSMNKSVSSLTQEIGIFQAQVLEREKTMEDKMCKLGEWKHDQQKINLDYEKRILALEIKVKLS